MRTAKYILTAVILAIAVIAALVAANWQSLLSPEQKLRYGLVFAATDDYARAARDNPDDPEALRDYVDVLVRRGNLGRAYYLSRLYGVEHEGLSALRVAIEKSIEAGHNDKTYALGDDPAVAPYMDDPLRQAIRYAEGYRHALLGDWMSAKNHFNAIEPNKLAPELRLYYQYYLARSYRLAGDEEEKAQVEGLLDEVANSLDPLLAGRAEYNLLAHFIDQIDHGSELGSKAVRSGVAAYEAGGWAAQKSCIEQAEYAIAGGRAAEAIPMLISALEVDPASQSAKGAAQTLLDLASAELAAARANGRRVSLECYSVSFSEAAARAMELHGMADAAAPVFDDLAAQVDPQQRDSTFVPRSLLIQAVGDSYTMAHLLSEPAFAEAPPDVRAAVYFNFARLYEARKQWNDALSYYRKVIDLGGEDASRAHLARYDIVKRVQDPFDVAAAIAELEYITGDHDASAEYAKAVEELIPLLIFAGQKGEAAALATEAMGWQGGPDVAQRTVDQLSEVGLYWKCYILEQDSGRGVAGQLRRDMPVKYWNYYELTTSYPPLPELADKPLLLGEPEGPGEYLAGLGLTWAASEYYDAMDRSDSQLLMFFELANGEVSKSAASRQWDATEILESGTVRERPLLEYVLREAYPMPFTVEIAEAARQSGVDPALICAVIKKETNFRADSVSWAGARGLMQLMPDTASWLNNRYGLGLNLDRIMEPGVNIRLGAAYLKSLQDDLGESSVRAVIHAYNGGPGNYRRWKANYPADQVLFTDLVPNEENETFAKKVIKYYKVYDWLLSNGTLAPD